VFYVDVSHVADEHDENSPYQEFYLPVAHPVIVPLPPHRGQLT
jgi:hypothetical protein